MAGGIVAPSNVASRAHQYEAKVTVYVVIVAIVAASGGLLFGYDLGVTGGVTSMTPFLLKFFPDVYAKQQATADSYSGSVYCKFEDAKLQLFTSSLFLAGMAASLVAGWMTRKMGRKFTMSIASICFLIGTGLCAGAQDLAMLVIGRIFLGFGIGFANQVVPLYLSEVAPPHARGALNICFQMATTLGILAAQIINYYTNQITAGYGWRISLAGAGVPAIILLIGSILLPETPNSLIERSQIEKGRAVLQRVRGKAANVSAEFDDILEAAALSESVTHPFKNIMQAGYRPQLITAVLIPFFQQFTGINAIMFYAPQLFSAFGNSQQWALRSTLIIGAVNVGSTIVSIVMVDRVGRKALFLEGGIQMFIATVALAGILGSGFQKYGNALPQNVSAAAVAIICIYVAAFAWSWGPLGWLVPSEIQPLETRSASTSITTFVNFLFSFVIGQAFLSMMCSMRWGVFLFFAFWIVIMTLYTSFFLPETKGVPIEEMILMWRAHWFWKRVVPASTNFVGDSKTDYLHTGNDIAPITKV